MKYCVFVILGFFLSLHAVAENTPNIKSKSVSILDFNYIQLSETGFRTTHAMTYDVKKPEHFETINPHSYQAIFHDHPFNITMAGFVKNDQIVIVHAEKVTDDSGFLDYSYKAPSTLSGIDFFMSERCAELRPEDVQGAQDLAYLDQQGYAFNPSIYLRQYFKSSKDGNSEIVVTFGQKVSDCSVTQTAQFKAGFESTLVNALEILPL